MKIYGTWFITASLALAVGGIAQTSSQTPSSMRTPAPGTTPSSSSHGPKQKVAKHHTPTATRGTQSGSGEVGPATTPGSFSSEPLESSVTAGSGAKSGRSAHRQTTPNASPAPSTTPRSH